MLEKELEKLCESLSHELTKTNSKIERSNGEINPGMLEYIDKLTHSIKSIKSVMDQGHSYQSTRSYGGSYNGSYDGSYDGSYENSRYSGRRYSRNTEMVTKLRNLMGEAPEAREDFERLISKVEMM